MKVLFRAPYVLAKTTSKYFKCFLCIKRGIKLLNITWKRSIRPTYRRTHLQSPSISEASVLLGRRQWLPRGGGGTREATGCTAHCPQMAKAAGKRMKWANFKVGIWRGDLPLSAGRLKSRSVARWNFTKKEKKGDCWESYWPSVSKAA